MAPAHGVQVAEDAVHHEGCEGRRELRDGLQAGVERLVGGQLVLGHSAAPETLAVQTHVPVREVLAHELLDGAGGRRRVVVLERLGHVLDQRVEQRDNPAVDFRTALDGHLLLAAGEAVDVGVEGEEGVGVVERAEELAAHLVHAVAVELEVVPRLRVRNHVPPRGVGAVGREDVEGVDGIAQTLRHLVAVLVEHQTVRDDVAEGHRVEEHRGDGVQREEPAARLVDTLGDEVGRVDRAEVVASVFEGVVQLGIGHGTRVEPYVDEVRFAAHRLALRRDEHN